MAEPTIDPSEHTVGGLRSVLDLIDDVDELEYMLEWEELGDDRSTAKKAIRSRIHDIENGDGKPEGTGDLQGLDLGADQTTLMLGGVAAAAVLSLYLRFFTGLVDSTFEGAIVFGALALMVVFALQGSGSRDGGDGDGGFEMPQFVGDREWEMGPIVRGEDDE